MFFQLIDKRYEKKSTIITSNINLSDWSDIFVDNMLASAILDRLVHHSSKVKLIKWLHNRLTNMLEMESKNITVGFTTDKRGYFKGKWLKLVDIIIDVIYTID